ncbi:MAG TPA: dTDP-4-dehydrorhamnose 3,5-epimerase [Acidimicrobiia bacterium]|nr:dTDP-4-dehydrorhamnose 3,5-epimerase [Acidimicrobiia bacterium]
MARLSNEPEVIEASAFEDSRGFFIESFNQAAIEDRVGDFRWVQDNHSRSRVGVIRGLHYQLPPKAQGKLVMVIRGAIFDVAVDIRRTSPTFGNWTGVHLSDENHRQYWIPPGFAHGFVALTDPADVVYKVTEYYSSEHDRAIRWDDPDIGIEWPVDVDPIISERDATAPYLRDADVFA